MGTGERHDRDEPAIRTSAMDNTRPTVSSHSHTGLTNRYGAVVSFSELAKNALQNRENPTSRFGDYLDVAGLVDGDHQLVLTALDPSSRGRGGAVALSDLRDRIVTFD